MKKLEILNINSLKIRKVKCNKIYFDYFNRHYMILDNDELLRVSLYEREFNEFGYTKAHYMATSRFEINAMKFIKDISKNNSSENITYSNIDKEFFIKQLTLQGLIVGMYLAEYESNEIEKEEIRRSIKKLQYEIQEFNTKLINIDKNYLKTNNHGSKQYTNKLKEEISERVKGANEGTYCKEYNAYYGDIHPLYGGVLTDLFNLKCGTVFQCTNGNWYGLISADEHGDKAVIPLKGFKDKEETIIKLTSKNHSLYIKLEED